MRRAVRGLEGQSCGVVDAALPLWRCEAKARQDLSEVAASKNRSAAEFQDPACLASLANRKRVGAEESEKYVVENYSKTSDLILKRGRESEENIQMETFIHPKGGIGH
jgi:hypothetical protein